MAQTQIIIRSDARLDAMRQGEEKARATIEPRAVATGAHATPTTKAQRRQIERTGVRLWSVDINYDLAAAAACWSARENR